MTTPAILYRNLLDIASSGRGDGTIYAHGTGATPVVADKTFDLTAGYTEMADLTPGDNLHNGAVLNFTVSNRSYLITDWVTATELATTYETPNAEDTGAWTIRRTLYTDDFNVANPVRFGANGRLFQKWIDKAANNTASIFAAAPNGVDDGGFESNDIDTYSSDDSGGTGTSAVNAVSPILGTYDCKLTRGDTYGGRKWTGQVDLRVGYTNGIIIKTSGDGGVSGLRVRLLYTTYGDVVAIPITFSKIDGGDSLSNSGNGTDNVWLPPSTDAAEWQEITFIVPENLNAGEWELSIRCDTGESNDVFIDEIYLWEIGPTPADGSIPNPDTLIIGGHNMAGGWANDSNLDGQRCPQDLTSYAPADEDTMLDLNDKQQDGLSPGYFTFTAPSVIFPIYSIEFVAVSGKTWEAAEMWIGKLWQWEKYPNSPLTGKQRTIETTNARARGGPRVSEKIYQQKVFSSTQELIDDTEVIEWVRFIEDAGYGKPFWLRIQTAAALGVIAETVFVNCKTVPTLEEGPPIYYTASFSFEEAF